VHARIARTGAPTHLSQQRMNAQARLQHCVVVAVARLGCRARVVDWEKDIYRGKYADVSDEEERKKKDLELKRREGSGFRGQRDRLSSPRA
jgi:hypothetical protein